MTNVINKDIFVCLDVIWITIFDTDCVIEKLVFTVFDISFSYPTHVYTNMIISMELIIHTSHNT